MWPFNRRAKELEFKNKLLVETDKRRAQRVENLELEVETLTNRVFELEAQLKIVGGSQSGQGGESNHDTRPLTAGSPPTESVRIVQAERGFYQKQASDLSRHNQLLTDAATRYSYWGQELDRLLGESGLREAEREDAWRKFVEPLGLGFVRYELRGSGQG